MRVLFVVVLAVLCTACAKDHGKPIASLFYRDFSGAGDGFYDLGFRSDVDLLHLFKPGEGFVGGRLTCALSEDKDFSVEHVMQKSGYGPLEPATTDFSGEGFAFVASLSFRETVADGSSSRSMDGAEIRDLLAGRQVIPCQYVATIFGSKPYYSGTLSVPVRDILRELDKRPGVSLP